MSSRGFLFKLLWKIVDVMYKAFCGATSIILPASDLRVLHCSHVHFGQGGASPVGRRHGIPSRRLHQEIRAPAVLPGELKTYEITNGYNGGISIVLIHTDRLLTYLKYIVFHHSQFHLPVREHHAGPSTDGEHHQHVRPLHPHRGRQLGDLLAESGGSPARVALSITSLLTLCTQAQQNKSQLPPLNYITAVDIWLFTCMFMVFSSLVEFAIAYNLFMKKKAVKFESVMQTPFVQRERQLSTWVVKVARINKKKRVLNLRSRSGIPAGIAKWKSLISTSSVENCFRSRSLYLLLSTGCTI
ncbi:glycine receptor subunit alpha-3 [Caerostris extrusa]|uniref:Glycine receptor subunit alpha-3 n=1 Tax=Caerostris extrusa TaxID=172846 RepID=A0AAV4W217_CAEEX|nr:glycine receptor subunit alpha-3 [Caerostris extrusa]